jgi:hypothetical protein
LVWSLSALLSVGDAPLGFFFFKLRLEGQASLGKALEGTSHLVLKTSGKTQQQHLQLRAK